MKGHSREVVSLAISPDGKSLASRGADAVKVWDAIGGRETSTFPSDGSDFASVTFSPDGKTIAANRPGKGIDTWEVASGRERSYPTNYETKGHSCYSASYGWGVAYSPDGKTLAGGGSHGGEDGFLTLWETASGEGVDLSPLDRPITTVAFSPDGRTIASGSMDGKLVLWDVATRKERRRIEANRSYLAPVVFSPDGRVVASSNEARWVRFWDVATGRPVGTMKGHIKAVLSMAFSPDGKTLVSGDSGGTLIVWDVPGLKMMVPLLSSDRGKVWGLAFSPDGKNLAASGEDRLIHLWDVTWPEGAESGR